MHPTARKLERRLRGLGLDVEVRELDRSTRTAADAAAASGCDVGQIVKSLVLVAGGEPVLCLCAGDRRVRLEWFGPDARMASAEEARAATGFAVGGVPPLGHDRPLRTVVDASLSRFQAVWCAAGTPRAVFSVDLEALLAALPAAELVEDVAAGAQGPGGPAPTWREAGGPGRWVGPPAIGCFRPPGRERPRKPGPAGGAPGRLQPFGVAGWRPSVAVSVIVSPSRLISMVTVSPGSLPVSASRTCSIVVTASPSIATMMSPPRV